MMVLMPKPGKLTLYLFGSGRAMILPLPKILCLQNPSCLGSGFVAAWFCVVLDGFE